MAVPSPRHGSRASQADEEPPQTTNVRPFPDAARRRASTTGRKDATTIGWSGPASDGEPPATGTRCVRFGPRVEQDVRAAIDLMRSIQRPNSLATRNPMLS